MEDYDDACLFCFELHDFLELNRCLFGFKLGTPANDLDHYELYINIFEEHCDYHFSGILLFCDRCFRKNNLTRDSIYQIDNLGNRNQTFYLLTC